MTSISQPRLRDRAPKGGATSPVNDRFYKGGQFWPARPAGPDIIDLIDEPAPITLAIYGFGYTVRLIDAGECGTVAYEMHRTDTNHTYHVIRTHHGLVKCDCGDYLFRHDGTASTCKHGSALVAKGLMAAPSPILSTVGRRVFLTPTCSVLENATPERIDYPARPRRFVPSPAEMAEAAQLFADFAGAF